MTDPFASPATANGIKWAEVNNSLVIVEVLAVEHGIQTAFGESDAVRANISILDGELKGESYEDCLVFPRALRAQLSSRVGSKVIGRVGQGAAKAGQSPPWLLSEATDADRKAGVEFLANGFATASTGGGAKPPF